MVYIGGQDEIVLALYLLPQIVIYRLGRILIAVDPDIAAPVSPTFFRRIVGVEPAGVHIVEAVFLLKIGEMPCKPLTAVGKTCRSGQPPFDPHGLP